MIAHPSTDALYPGSLQAKSRRNAAGQATRVDEAAPSAAYLQSAVAAGDVRSARSMGRGGLKLQGGTAGPSPHTAAGMAWEIQQLEAEAAAAAPGPLPRPPAQGRSNVFACLTNPCIQRLGLRVLSTLSGWKGGGCKGFDFMTSIDNACVCKGCYCFTEARRLHCALNSACVAISAAAAALTHIVRTGEVLQSLLWYRDKCAYFPRYRRATSPAAARCSRQQVSCGSATCAADTEARPRRRFRTCKRRRQHPCSC